MVRHVQPAAGRAGIRKRIGWHTFRHTLATLLQASGAGVKVTQELLRHSSAIMTLGTYAKAVTGDKRDAQDTVGALFLKPQQVKWAAERLALIDPYWTHGHLLDLRTLLSY